MSSVLNAHSKKIAKLEDMRASEGTISTQTPSIETEIHLTQVKSWDTRKALALSIIHQKETPLSYIRSLLQRGNFEQAKPLIQELKTQCDPSVPTALALVLFEEARLAFFESCWPAVITRVQEALDAGSPPANLIPLYQLRANACFELGKHPQACADIDDAQQMESVFPHAVSLLYVQTLKARVIARQTGIAEAQEFLDQILLKHLTAGRCDLDLLLTYLRVQIDFKRLVSKDFSREAIACFLLSDAIGDKLYCGLAELDFLSGRCLSRDEFAEKSSELRARFRRIDRIVTDVQTAESPSTSAATIRAQIGNQARAGAVPFPVEGSFGSWEIVHFRLGIYCSLETGKLTRLGPESQLLRALKVIALGQPTKKEFFAQIWGRQAYAPRLHDTLITSLLHRLKKECGLVARIRESKIETEKKVLLV